MHLINAVSIILTFNMFKPPYSNHLSYQAGSGSNPNPSNSVCFHFHLGTAWGVSAVDLGHKVVPSTISHKATSK